VFLDSIIDTVGPLNTAPHNALAVAAEVIEFSAIHNLEDEESIVISVSK
jgi:hypothetical protein